MSERVMVFIDGPALYHELKTRFERRLNFETFAKKLVGDRRLVRIYYYDAVVDQTQAREAYKMQQRFFTALQSIPYWELRLGHLVYRPNGAAYEKGLDMRLALDMLAHAVRDNFDVAILVSGDSDFVDAVRAVKDQGKHLEVAFFASTSRALRDVADRAIILEEKFLADCWM